MAKRGSWQEKEQTAAEGVRGGRIEPTPTGVLVHCEDDGLVLQPFATGTIRFASMAGWRGRRFSVPAEIAHQLELVAMHSGMQSYLLHDRPLDCSTLSDALCVRCRQHTVAEELDCEFPLVMPGQELRLVFRNKSDQPVKPRATFEADRVPFDPAAAPRW